MITVEPIMLMYAFRYALGRPSYSVGDVADALIAHASDLRPDWRRQIIRDIDEAIEEGRAGDFDDAQRWRHVADLIAAQDRATT